ncbi:type II toxin-antitoxin system YafO family toxin [Escherichia coli]|nr:type II toxin-antitoxin system YafO family toxin [Escherichia coli]
MSSSASQNDKNQIVRYKGRVLHTHNFSALCASDLELKKVSDAFTQYWKTGYHPSLGKDAAFARPTEMLKLNVRHTHVDNQDYIPEDSDKKHTGKKSSWDAWKNIASVQVKCIPTSDCFLVYSVNHNRDALVMFFVDADAHNITEQEEFKEAAITISYQFFEKTKTEPMPLEEDLFSDKWKE